MKQVYGIRIKFCGGCNPEIERGSVIKKFKELVASSGKKYRFDFDNDDKYDLLILVNGCQHACLEEDDTINIEAAKYISIKGPMIGLNPVAENDLPKALLIEIEQISLCD